MAMETSGHGALKENHWLDDGAYMMVRVLVLLHSLNLYEHAIIWEPDEDVAILCLTLVGLKRSL